MGMHIQVPLKGMLNGSIKVACNSYTTVSLQEIPMIDGYSWGFL